MNILRLIILFSFFNISLNAKNIDTLKVDTVKYTFSTMGIGLGQNRVSYLSPILYSSYEIKYSISEYKELGKGTISTCYDIGLGLNVNKNNNIIVRIGEDYFYNRRYSLLRSQIKPDFSIGWGYWYDDDFYIKPDNTNNVIYANLNNKACFTFDYKKTHKNLFFRNEFVIPVFGLYYGSKYSQNLPGIIEKEGRLIDAFKLGSFNTNFQFSNKCYIDLKIKTKKEGFVTLRVQYEVEYSILHLHNNIKQSINHFIQVGYLITKAFYVHK